MYLGLQSGNGMGGLEGSEAAALVAGREIGSNLLPNLIKSSRAISRVRCTLYTDVSMSMMMMMMTEMDIETSVYNVHLTWLIAREDFIKFTRRESTKTYIVAECYHSK
jgi:hypothetical protein